VCVCVFWGDYKPNMRLSPLHVMRDAYVLLSDIEPVQGIRYWVLAV
jgi:hypothetical protein